MGSASVSQSFYCLSEFNTFDRVGVAVRILCKCPQARSARSHKNRKTTAANAGRHLTIISAASEDGAGHSAAPFPAPIRAIGARRINLDMRARLDQPTAFRDCGPGRPAACFGRAAVLARTAAVLARTAASPLCNRIRPEVPQMLLLVQAG